MLELPLPGLAAGSQHSDNTKFVFHRLEKRLNMRIAARRRYAAPRSELFETWI
jgi:hypothetical protein